jgi:hypothetical protein
MIRHALGWVHEYGSAVKVAEMFTTATQYCSETTSTTETKGAIQIRRVAPTIQVQEKQTSLNKGLTRSYNSRFLESLSTSYASLISLNFSGSPPAFAQRNLYAMRLLASIPGHA